jgi:hypothetical protein
MIDSFPYDSWLNADGATNTDITTFWTFGPTYGAEGGSLTGTYILTAIGMALFVIAMLAWIIQEDRKMKEQSARLRGQ